MTNILERLQIALGGNALWAEVRAEIERKDAEIERLRALHHPLDAASRTTEGSEMTDIVERLRGDGQKECRCIYCEAADEIERLRAAAADSWDVGYRAGLLVCQARLVDIVDDAAPPEQRRMMRRHVRAQDADHQ